MYKIILFDLDGTITDSGPGILNSIIYSLNKMGFSIPDDDTLNKFIGPPLIASYAKYCGMTDEQTHEALALYREYFVDKGMFENSVYEGIEDVFRSLKADGCRLVVATAKPDEFTKKILDYFNLTDYFDLIAAATMDEKRNTKDAVIGWALDQLNITEENKSEVVMVGDRSQDISGAKMHGLNTIGVLYGYGSEKELSEAGADHLAKRPEDILKYLKRG